MAILKTKRMVEGGSQKYTLYQQKFNAFSLTGCIGGTTPTAWPAEFEALSLGFIDQKVNTDKEKKDKAYRLFVSFPTGRTLWSGVRFRNGHSFRTISQNAILLLEVKWEKYSWNGLANCSKLVAPKNLQTVWWKQWRESKNCSGYRQNSTWNWSFCSPGRQHMSEYSEVFDECVRVRLPENDLNILGYFGSFDPRQRKKKTGPNWWKSVRPLLWIVWNEQCASVGEFLQSRW